MVYVFIHHFLYVGAVAGVQLGGKGKDKHTKHRIECGKCVRVGDACKNATFSSFHPIINCANPLNCVMCGCQNYPIRITPYFFVTKSVGKKVFSFFLFSFGLLENEIIWRP